MVHLFTANWYVRMYVATVAEKYKHTNLQTFIVA